MSERFRAQVRPTEIGDFEVRVQRFDADPSLPPRLDNRPPGRWITVASYPVESVIVLPPYQPGRGNVR